MSAVEDLAVAIGIILAYLAIGIAVVSVGMRVAPDQFDEDGDLNRIGVSVLAWPIFLLIVLVVLVGFLVDCLGRLVARINNIKKES